MRKLDTHVARTQADYVAQEDRTVGGQHGIDLIDEFDHALGGIDKGPVNRLVAGNLHDQINYPHERRRFQPQHAESRHLKRQNLDHRFERCENAVDGIDNGFKEVRNQGADLDTHVSQLDNEFASAVVDVPSPL